MGTINRLLSLTDVSDGSMSKMINQSLEQTKKMVVLAMPYSSCQPIRYLCFL
uniref:Uncharacterized protein n=1 Tax=Picea glauca TaxID=3330 RepID=A0A117NGJ8_PICGL|nr:hypothetical protein ABT39_MTgene6368 [Picea glauca]QHR86311.1 hypothetical protein Q903MT_gene310 [Picea sitchensis]